MYATTNSNEGTAPRVDSPVPRPVDADSVRRRALVAGEVRGGSVRPQCLEPDGTLRLTPDELHRFKIEVLGWNCSAACPGACMKASHQLVTVPAVVTVADADPYEAADRFCASYCGTSRHLTICPLGIGGPELLPPDAMHSNDSQCTVDTTTGCCTGCGVEFGPPCVCGGRGYHAGDCSVTDDPLLPFRSERAA